MTVVSADGLREYLIQRTDDRDRVRDLGKVVILSRVVRCLRSANPAFL